MAIITLLHSNSVIQGTDSDDMIVLAVSNSATIYGDSTGGSSNLTFNYPFAGLIGPLDPGIPPFVIQHESEYISPPMPQFDNDNIVVVAGNVTVYGDAGTLSLNVIGPSATVDNTFLPQDQSFSAFVKLLLPTNDPVNNAAVQFGNDTIVTGLGNATVIGDVGEQDITCSIAPGGSAPTFDSIAGAYIGDSDVNSGSPYNGLSIHFGNDSIIAGYGVDALYGDAMNMVHSCLGGTAFVPDSFTNTSILALYTFGNDTIVGGNLSNLIVGDVGKYDIEMIAGSNSGGDEAHYDMKATFGNDNLTGGLGTNAIYGDIQNWTMNFHGSDNAVGTSAPFGENIDEAEADNSLFMMGNDKIISNGTNDTLVGDVGTWTYNATAGNNTSMGSGFFMETSADVVDGSSIHFGNDTITENGHGSAILYGDTQIVNMNFHGGVNTVGLPDLADTLSVAGIGALLIHDIADSNGLAYVPYNNPIVFGDDTLSAVSGNDILYGDGDTWNINAVAGSASGVDADASVGFGESVNFGSNTLIGGAGNDTEYGSFKTLNFHLTDGKANGNVSGVDSANNVYATAQLAGTITGTDGPSGPNVTGFHFGNNKVVGGSGNDMLFGSVGTFNYYHTDANNNAVQDSFFANTTWGNNILFGAQGNDTITGGVGTLNTNQLNVSVGGNNEFVYDGHMNNGNDTITDFHTTLDQIIGQNGATFSNGGVDSHGNVIVNVFDSHSHSAGTIALLGVHSFASVAPDIHTVATVII